MMKSLTLSMIRVTLGAALAAGLLACSSSDDTTTETPVQQGARFVTTKACASCHRLFGEGGDIGPDLTGAQRMNLDYVLENVLDPSAIVPREYQVTVVETKGGRTISGIVKKENDAAITLQLQNEVVVLPIGDIDRRTATKLSMMPDGAFEQMKLEEVRDLVAYLASPVQVAMKK